MDYQNKLNRNEFDQYLQSLVKLDELQKMTDNLDQELKVSQHILNEIKSNFNNIPDADNIQHLVDRMRHEDISQFLDDDVPKLLLPDMTVNADNIDLCNVIATMKTYVEDIKKKLTLVQPKENQVPRSIDNLDLAPYASSLDQIAKQIGKMQLSTQEAEKNEELEQKLNQLCLDVNLFTQMVEVKTMLSKINQNWAPVKLENGALDYVDVISKLLSTINEVTYLLNNRN